jgi:hypothetical protein
MLPQRLPLFFLVAQITPHNSCSFAQQLRLGFRGRVVQS